MEYLSEKGKWKLIATVDDIKMEDFVAWELEKRVLCNFVLMYSSNQL